MKKLMYGMLVLSLAASTNMFAALNTELRKTIEEQTADMGMGEEDVKQVEMVAEKMQNDVSLDAAANLQQIIAEKELELSRLERSKADQPGIEKSADQDEDVMALEAKINELREDKERLKKAATDPNVFPITDEGQQALQAANELAAGRALIGGLGFMGGAAFGGGAFETGMAAYNKPGELSGKYEAAKAKVMERKMTGAGAMMAGGAGAMGATGLMLGTKTGRKVTQYVGKGVLAAKRAAGTVYGAIKRQVLEKPGRLAAVGTMVGAYYFAARPALTEKGVHKDTKDAEATFEKYDGKVDKNGSFAQLSDYVYGDEGVNIEADANKDTDSPLAAVVKVPLQAVTWEDDYSFTINWKDGVTQAEKEKNPAKDFIARVQKYNDAVTNLATATDEIGAKRDKLIVDKDAYANNPTITKRIQKTLDKYAQLFIDRDTEAASE